jgi:hypothetical protein
MTFIIVKIEYGQFIKIVEYNYLFFIKQKSLQLFIYTINIIYKGLN